MSDVWIRSEDMVPAKAGEYWVAFRSERPDGTKVWMIIPKFYSPNSKQKWRGIQPEYWMPYRVPAPPTEEV